MAFTVVVVNLIAQVEQGYCLAWGHVNVYLIALVGPLLLVMWLLVQNWWSNKSAIVGQSSALSAVGALEMCS